MKGRKSLLKLNDPKQLQQLRDLCVWLSQAHSPTGPLAYGSQPRFLDLALLRFSGPPVLPSHLPQRSLFDKLYPLSGGT